MQFEPGLQPAFMLGFTSAKWDKNVIYQTIRIIYF